MSASTVDPTERALIDRAARGDRDARHELFVRFRDQAYVVAYRITGRDEDALDVVQDAFIKAFDSLPTFQQDSGFKTWLTRIVSNKALDLLRARKVRRSISIERSGSDEDGSVELAESAVAGREPEAVSASAERRELKAQLQAALQTLPPDQRVVFALYAEGGYTYAEIAEIVEIPIGTVMSRIFYARKRLEKLLAHLAPDGGAI